VVGEDLRELFLVLEQRLDGPRGELGKRLVGRREHGERALALQRIDEAGRLDRLDEGVELAGRDGGVDDVGRAGERGGGGKRRGSKQLFHGLPFVQLGWTTPRPTLGTACRLQEKR
jgi:hypothetical protein